MRAIRKQLILLNMIDSSGVRCPDTARFASAAPGQFPLLHRPGFLPVAATLVQGAESGPSPFAWRRGGREAVAVAPALVSRATEP